MLKRTVTVILLVFVAVTIAVQVVKEHGAERPASLKDGCHLLFFHAAARCPTCLAMERLTRETLSVFSQEGRNNGGFDLQICGYDDPAYRDIARELQVGTAGIVIVEVRKGNIVRNRNLIRECWTHVSDDSGFREMVSSNLAQFLKGDAENEELGETGREMILEPSVNLFE